jgi:DNA-binding SARP family transcriptional activator/tetratricopeptide (TPR) repeat protein
LVVGVLGQLEVSVDGRAVRLTTGRLRTLLAVLAMAAGRTVPIARLTAAVWADDPPAHPRRTLQTYAARLRSELGDGVVVGQPAGLVLDVEADAVDALRFERLLDDAARRAAPDQERRLLVEALDLWRGDPFEGVASPWLEESVAPRLVERRLAALERRIDLDLATGRAGELVNQLNELTELTARHPMREPMWVRLLVVLDRCGRRADALERYEQIRVRIADELGVDPSPELQQVYADLLADRPTTTATTATATTPAAERPAQVPVPRQLPAPPPGFVGRAAELAQLHGTDDTDGGSAVVITAIDGMAGVGKTALAVHTGRQLAGRYPDGQLFLDLHGFTEGVTPVEPSDALDRMLRSLGVPGEQIPPALDDRAALFRSRLADQRMLILLDNAATEEQVTPLLPGSPGCLVLITSRRRLPGLDHTHLVSLDALPPTDAVHLFTQTAGPDRLTGVEQETLHDIADLCGRLPLALRIAAARLRAHPHWTVGHLIDRLSDRQQRLAELEAGHRSVLAALDLSYQQLTTTQQRAYRLTGTHPGTDLDPHAAAALLNLDVPATWRLLDQLVDAHLLQEPTPNRYQFHDLVRQHALLTAEKAEPEPARQTALKRLFTHYTHTAAVAMDTVYPFERERRPPPDTRNPVPDVGSPDLATAWLNTELPNLLATAKYSAEHGWHDYPSRLSATLDLHLMNRSRTSDAETLHHLALQAAEAAGDPIAEINALVRLGLSHRRAGQYPDAETHYQRILRLAHEHEYPAGQIEALHGLGQIQRLRSQFTDAADSFSRALDIAGAVDYPFGELQALLGLGGVYRDCAQRELAAKYLRQSLALARDTGHRPSELDALIGLGWAHLAHDDYEQAVDAFDQSLDIARALGYRIGEMVSLIGLGSVHRKQGHYEAAAELYEDVLGRARQIGNGNWIFEALQGLGRTRLGLDRPDEALAYHREALSIAVEMGQPADVARAHDGIANAHHARDEHDHAQHHWRQALDILTDLGIDSTSEDWETSATTIRGHLATYSE